MKDCRVLVVEDNIDTRHMIKLLLEVCGCQVLEASDGEVATRLAKDQQPQLILMDLMLPQVNGFEATRQIRKMEGMSQVPIIVLSAFVNDPDIRNKAIREGVNECLQKPDDIKKLKSIIIKYIGS